MSGVAVIVGKLTGYGALTALVPTARIFAGDLPENTTLPAISVTQISSVPTVKVNGAVSMNTDRVQVTVLAKKTPNLRDIMRQVRAACPHTRGTVNTIKCDSILPDIEGPDFSDDPVTMVGCSRDFIVRWTD